MARLVVGLGGSVRGIATDKLPWREMFPGHSPPRASHVEIIDLEAIASSIKGLLPVRVWKTLLQEVKKCKQGTMYFVDFSPLADVTGNPIYRCCLARTFARREEALKSEVAWLNENYVEQEAGTPRNDNWAKALNLNALNRKLPKPAGADTPAGGPIEPISEGS